MVRWIAVARLALVGLCALVGLNGCSVIVAGALKGKGADGGVTGDMSVPDMPVVDMPFTGPCTSDEQCQRVTNPCDGMETCSEGLCFAGTPIGDGISCDADHDPVTPDFCQAGRCVASLCGDGIQSGTEACDDGNVTDGDGCDADCTLTCTSSVDCDDTNPCTDDTCPDSTCKHVAAAGAVMCDAGGMCAGGVCVPAGCGDGSVDPGTGEQCDPPDGLGCLPNCQWQCETDAQCDDGDVCNGDATCDVMMHACSVPIALDCDDGVGCTVDSCLAVGGCQHELQDADGDGFGPLSCGGEDCNDADLNVFPGAPEACNALDDDCNGMVDDGVMDVTWYQDADGDGFGNPNVSTVSCMRPAGFVADKGDCYDVNASVHPYLDPAPFFTVDRGDGSFDYDCDDNTNRRYGPPMCTDGGRNPCGLGRSCIGLPGIMDTRSNCGVAYPAYFCNACHALAGTCGVTGSGSFVQACN